MCSILMLQQVKMKVLLTTLNTGSKGEKQRLLLCSSKSIKKVEKTKVTSSSS